MYQERVKSVIACKTDRNKLAASGVYSTSDERSQIKLKTIEKNKSFCTLYLVKSVYLRLAYISYRENLIPTQYLLFL